MPYSYEPLLVKELARRAKRYKELLQPAPAADAIPAARGTGLRTVSEEGDAGIASPLTEQAYTGDTWYQITSSDGLFVFEYSATTLYYDASGRQVVVVHLDPDA
jgi:hypothetical protein